MDPCKTKNVSKNFPPLVQIPFIHKWTRAIVLKKKKPIINPSKNGSQGTEEGSITEIKEANVG